MGEFIFLALLNIKFILLFNPFTQMATKLIVYLSTKVALFTYYLSI
ncbi:MAG: hypothetical protein ACI85O_002823 [Saprospiraceae bacterium]|jgi:hypothetical protein